MCILHEFIAKIHLHIRHILTNLLFFGFLADKQYIIVFHNNIIFQPLNHYNFVFRHMDNTLLRVVGFHMVTHNGIFMGIFGAQFVQLTPCSQIGPSKIGSDNFHILCVFHYTIVNRDAAADLVYLVNEGLFLICAVESVALFEKFVHVG